MSPGVGQSYRPPDTGKAHRSPSKTRSVAQDQQQESNSRSPQLNTPTAEVPAESIEISEDHLLSGDLEPIALGPRRDRFEKEADAAADRASAGDGDAGTATPPSIPTPTRASSATPSWITPKHVTGAELLALLHAPRAGKPMPAATARQVSSAVGSDVSHLRVHTGPDVRRAGQLLDSSAFAFGSDLWLSNPADINNTALLAHESTHSLQQRSGPPVIQRFGGDGSEEPDLAPLSEQDGSYPPSATVTYTSFREITITPIGPARPLPEKPYAEHFASVYAKHLLGERYEQRYVTSFLRALANDDVTETGRRSIYPRFTISSVVAYRLASHLYNIIDPRNLQMMWDVLKISQENLEMLYVARFSLGIAQAMNSEQYRNDNDLPGWYSESIAVSHLQAIAGSVREEAMASLSSGADEDFTRSADSLFPQMWPDILTVDEIRATPELRSDPGFRHFWGLSPLPAPDADANAAAVPITADGPSSSTVLSTSKAISLLRFVHTQPGFVRRINEGYLDLSGISGDIRVELWYRYQRRMGRTTTRSDTDFEMVDNLSDRNAPPFPATIHRVPGLDSGDGWSASLSTSHLFTMNVGFSDVYDRLAEAFGGFHYHFEVLRVPQSKVLAAANDDIAANIAQLREEVEDTAEEVQLGAGRQATPYDVLSHDVSQEVDYIAADAATLAEVAMENMSPSMMTAAVAAIVGGPVLGISAASPFAISALLRLTGTVIKNLVGLLTSDRFEVDVTFDQPGLYLVRGILQQSVDDQSEVRRFPTVAVAPIWIRSQEDIADRAMTSVLSDLAETRMQIARINGLVGEIEDEETRKAFVDWRNRMVEAISPNAGQRLDLLLADAEAELASTTLTSYRRGQVTEDVERLRNIIETRNDRIASSGRGEILTTIFVPDEGPTMHPLIEVFELEDTNPFRSDPSTTSYRAYELSSSRDATGRGSGSHPNDPELRRQRAIGNALEALFERYNAFGRGHLRVFVPDIPGGRQGEQLTLRIEADPTAIAMRTVEDVSNAAALVALAAAPFTGGASLVLMVPAGFVGAAPAAYRLFDQKSSDTLRFNNMATWLDMVDVLGAIAGPLGRVSSAGTRSSSRLLRVVAFTGRGVAIVGNSDAPGLILVNAHTLNETRKILNGPGTESQKKAQIALLLAGALQANGMSVAGRRLAQHAESLGVPRAHGDATTTQVDGPPVTDGPRTDNPGNDSRTPRRQANDDDLRVERVSGDVDPLARRLIDDPSLLSGLDPNVARGLRARRETEGNSTSIQVFFRTDAFGLVRHIELVVGARATAADIAVHAIPIAQLRQYQGLAGLARIALNRVRQIIGQRGDPRTDSLAFDALLELNKLPGMIALRNRQLAAAIEHGTPNVRDIEADIANFERQLEFFAEQFRTGYDQPSRGYVAALDEPSFQRMRDDLADQVRHQDQTTPANRAAWRADFSQRLRAVLDRLDQSGNLTDSDRQEIESFMAETSTSNGQGLSRTKIADRLRQLETLSWQLANGHQATQEVAVGDLRQHRDQLANAYDEGTTVEVEPRAIGHTPARDKHFTQELETAAQAVADSAAADQRPVAFGLAHEKARRQLVRIEQQMRALGDPHFTGSEQTVSEPGRSTIPELARFDGVTEQAVTAQASGRVTEGLDRTLPEVGLERYVDSASGLAEMPFRRRLAQRVRRLFRGYHRAHMVGPGFGSELFAGIWLAPDHFNLNTQNRGIEAIVRHARDQGWTVDVSMEATGRRVRLPTSDGGHVEVTILDSISYELRYATGGGEPSQTRRIEYQVGGPPNGEVTIGRNDFDRLGIDGLSDADLATLRGANRQPDPIGDAYSDPSQHEQWSEHSDDLSVQEPNDFWLEPGEELNFDQ